MAFSTNAEYDDIEFLMVGHPEHMLHCDVDLTCYETFYDSPPSKVENENVKELYSKCDLQNCIAVFERNETSIDYCSGVPDIDYAWPNTDGGVHDVVNLYNIVRDELFSDFSPEDITTCLSYGVDSPKGLQQVPLVADDRSGEIAKNSTVNHILQSCSSPCTTEKANCKVETAKERSVNIALSPAHSTESNSQDTDARVPSSCTSDILPGGWYYVEE